MNDRYVVLGVGQSRSNWFGTVAQWANSGTIPAEFVKCVSLEEVRARLGSGRPYSALLLDGSLAGLDRDLVEAARSNGCAVLAVDDQRGAQDWTALGVTGVLPEFFDPTFLMGLLSAQAVMISRGEVVAPEVTELSPLVSESTVVAVCGPGGTGSSTVCIALAQGLARASSAGPSVVLADLALHAEQAMLHDSRDVVPGVQELVEAHRSRRLGADEIRSLTFNVEERGYHLLLGLRRARSWSAIRPRAFEASLGSLRASFAAVVCDIDADFEAEEDGGSIEVEERHVMARTAILASDVVLAVGAPGMKGLHSLVRVLNELRSAGVDGERIVPVINRAPKAARARSDIAATVAGLANASGRRFGPCLFLPEKRVEEALRDGIKLPSVLADPLAGAVAAFMGRQGRSSAVPAVEPRRVKVGSLASWSDADTDGIAGHL